MTAAASAADCGTTAASVPTLNETLFEELTARLGADNDTARARLLDIDRADIARWRSGKIMPRLAKAMRVAEILGTTVDELFGPVTA